MPAHRVRCRVLGELGNDRYHILRSPWKRTLPESREGTGMPEERIVVVGGGVGGLTVALALGRSGHPVTVLERDPLPATADAEQAFEAERRGAPQVHQTHGFLARLQV